MLLALTVATGLADAVSFIKLGHVFVANMTGNVVFLGFALAGASGLSAPASLVALVAFVTGGFTDGRLGTLIGPHRGRLLRAMLLVEIPLVAGALVIALLAAQRVVRWKQYTVIPLLALAMGVQNACARRLAVPDLTTTVLTLTLTGIGVDSRIAGGKNGRPGRRGLGAVRCGVGPGSRLSYRASRCSTSVG